MSPNRIVAWIPQLFRDERAQDMVEYALLAGFVAVAAGALLPPVADSLSQIFSKVGSVTTVAAQN
jgi:Flp pilus assembly pilin Flp